MSDLKINNYPQDMPKAKYFGASSQNCGWVGGHNNWMYSLNGKFQTAQQKVAMYGALEKIQTPKQVAMTRTSKGLQTIPDEEQQIDAPKNSMLVGLEVSDMVDPLLNPSTNPLESNEPMRNEPIVPQ